MSDNLQSDLAAHCMHLEGIVAMQAAAWDVFKRECHDSDDCFIPDSAMSKMDEAISATDETVAKYKAELTEPLFEAGNVSAQCECGGHYQQLEQMFQENQKEIEPLRREVAMLNQDNKSLLSIAIRCHDILKTYGHLHAGLADDLLEAIKQSTQHIFHQQATAQAYEAEVERRGAVKALE